MIDGLWTAVFESVPTESVRGGEYGVGVLIFRDGKICGGNASAYVVGRYRMDGSSISAEVEGWHYSGEPVSIFGPVEKGKSYRFDLVGELAEPVMTLEGVMADDPEMRFEAFLTKRTGSEIL